MNLLRLFTLGLILASSSLAFAGAYTKDPDVLAAKQAANKIKSSIVGTPSCTGCQANFVTISQADINPSTGYTISSSGVYCLTQDILFSPTANSLSAITVNVPNAQKANVVINLNGYALAKDSSAAGTQTTGILINGQTNVIVMNGAVTDFDVYGIRLNSGSSTILLEDVAALRNGNTSSPFGGISAANSQDVVLSHVRANNNIGIGFSLAGTTQVVVAESSFDNNTTANVPGLGGPICWGLFGSNLLNGVSCRDVTVVSSSASNNKSNGVGIGMEFISIPFVSPVIENLRIIDCAAYDNTGGVPSSFTQEGEGFAVIGVNNFVLRGCQAQGNHSNATAPSGIAGNHSSSGYSLAFIDGNAIIDDCQAVSNNGNGDISAGFRIARSANVVVKNCVATNHQNNGVLVSATDTANNVYGEAWGFTTDPDIGNFLGTPSNFSFTFDGCNATNNNAPNAPSGNAGGFKFVLQTESVLTNCQAVDNDIGIYVSKPKCCSVPAGRSGSCCCLESANCCTAAAPACCTATSSNCACTSGLCATSSTCCPDNTDSIVSSNVVIGNRFGGIVDTSSSTGTAYYLNQARSNGDNGTLNYVGIISPTPTSCSHQGGSGAPIRLWVLPNGPCAKDNNGLLDPWDNMDIRTR